MHVFANIAAIGHIVSRLGGATIVLQDGTSWDVTTSGPNVMAFISRAETEATPPTIALDPAQKI